MKRHIRYATIAIACLAGAGIAAAQNAPGMSTQSPEGRMTTEQKVQFSPAQRTAIFKSVGQDRSHAATVQFRASVGAQVPSSIALYDLPDEAIATAPMARPYKYVLVQNQVVLIDPTTMRVIEVINQ